MVMGGNMVEFINKKIETLKKKEDNQIREEELLALKRLKTFFNEYQGLKPIADPNKNPDLVDNKNSIGVEVTRAINKEVARISGDFNREIKGKRYEDLEEKHTSNNKQIGLKYIEDKELGIIGIYRFLNKSEKELLHKCIKSKYAKKYEKLGRKDLYIFFTDFFIECLSEEDIKELFKTAHECEKEYGEVFSKIIIDFSGVYLVLDLKSNTTNTIEYDINKC